MINSIIQFTKPQNKIQSIAMLSRRWNDLRETCSNAYQSKQMLTMLFYFTSAGSKALIPPCSSVGELETRAKTRRQRVHHIEETVSEQVVLSESFQKSIFCMWTITKSINLEGMIAHFSIWFATICFCKEKRLHIAITKSLRDWIWWI